jgi:hypothetical protein
MSLLLFCCCFQDIISAKAIKEQISAAITDTDKPLIDDFYDYKSDTLCSWSLSRAHLHLLGRVIAKSASNDEAMLWVCRLLQSLVLRDDFVELLQREGDATLRGLLQQFDSYSDPVKTCTARMVTGFLIHGISCGSECS